MTYKGVLINANTRAVALRALTEAKKRYVKAAVLPDSVRDSEIALLELRLQMQKDLKEPYSLTNELLFIEEMYTEFQTPPEQIAAYMRLASGKRGENEIELRLRLLSFMRQLMSVPEEHLTLRFFDENDVKLQHLKDLLRAVRVTIRKGSRCRSPITRKLALVRTGRPDCGAQIAWC